MSLSSSIQLPVTDRVRDLPINHGREEQVSVQVNEMIEVWKQWESELINGEFHLRQYLGGSDHSAVFLTERSQGNPQKAAIKLIPPIRTMPTANFRDGSRGETFSSHLLGLFQMGRCQIGDRRLLYVVMEYAQEDLSQVLPHVPSPRGVGRHAPASCGCSVIPP